jgi:hypothetical protein
VSRTQAYEFIASHLMESADTWVCDGCLARTLAGSTVQVVDCDETVRDVVEELRGLAGFERGPAACGRCGKAALVAVRYVRNR